MVTVRHIEIRSAGGYFELCTSTPSEFSARIGPNSKGWRFARIKLSKGQYLGVTWSAGIDRILFLQECKEILTVIGRQTGTQAAESKDLLRLAYWLYCEGNTS